MTVLAHALQTLADTHDTCTANPCKHSVHSDPSLFCAGGKKSWRPSVRQGRLHYTGSCTRVRHSHEQVIGNDSAEVWHALSANRASEQSAVRAARHSAGVGTRGW